MSRVKHFDLVQRLAQAPRAEYAATPRRRPLVNLCGPTHAPSVAVHVNGVCVGHAAWDPPINAYSVRFDKAKLALAGVTTEQDGEYAENYDRLRRRVRNALVNAPPGAFATPRGPLTDNAAGGVATPQGPPPGPETPGAFLHRRHPSHRRTP